jgi:hypothetical protein
LVNAHDRPATKQPPFIVFATPSLYADVCFPYLQAMMETVSLLNARGINWACILSPGDPYLAKVRNSVATRALLEYPQMTKLFFLDADVGWDPAGALKLIESEHEFAAGIYPKKASPPEFPCELFLDAVENGKLIERDGWYRANAVPTGFLCLKREVLVKLAAGRGCYRDLDGKLKLEIFQMGFNASELTVVLPESDPNFADWVALGRPPIGWWWGEDYALCRQWRDLGGEIWVWPDIQFSHTGMKSWHNNFAPSVKAFAEGRVKFVDAQGPKSIPAADQLAGDAARAGAGAASVDSMRAPAP